MTEYEAIRGYEIEVPSHVPMLNTKIMLPKGRKVRIILRPALEITSYGNLQATKDVLQIKSSEVADWRKVADLKDFVFEGDGGKLQFTIAVRKDRPNSGAAHFKLVATK